jgi:hypothetical protein
VHFSCACFVPLGVPSQLENTGAAAKTGCSHLQRLYDSNLTPADNAIGKNVKSYFSELADFSSEKV